MTRQYTRPISLAETNQRNVNQNLFNLTNYVNTNVGANVKSYGAVGDGVTDDTAAIKSALAADPNIIISEGTYRVASNLTIPSSAVVIMGPGAIFQADALITITNNGRIISYGTDQSLISGFTNNGTNLTLIPGSGTAISTASGFGPMGLSIEQTMEGVGILPYAPFGVIPFNFISATDKVQANTASFLVNIVTSGTTWTGVKSGVSVTALQATTPTSGVINQVVGGSFTGRSIVAALAGTQQSVFGINPSALLDGSATGYDGCVGIEVDVGVAGTASVGDRIGIQVISVVRSTGGDTRGSSIDAAYVVGTNSGAQTWQTGIEFFANSLSTTATLLGSQATAGTINEGINLNNFTINNHAFLSPGFNVDGSGNVVGNAFTATTYLRSSVTTIANLPAASGVGGARYMVNNSSLPSSGNFGIAVTSSTANNVVPVFSDGTTWRIG